MTPLDSEDSRYFVRDISETDLLPTIIEEANYSDEKIRSLEGFLLRNQELAPDQRACIALTLGRCGWGRSEGALRQVRRQLDLSGHRAEAQVVRLAIELLQTAPNLRVIQRGEEGYQFTEAGEPSLFVEDPIAAHWHRQDRWGPPIRPNWALAARSLSDFRTAGEAVDAAMNGERVLIQGPQDQWVVTRAWLYRVSQPDTKMRWPRIRSLGRTHNSARSEQKLAFECEGAPIQSVRVLSEEGDKCEAFLLNMYRRIRDLSGGT